MSRPVGAPRPTWKRMSFFSHGTSLSANGLAYGEADMAAVFTTWSSSRPSASSTGPPLRMYVPGKAHRSHTTTSVKTHGTLHLGLLGKH